MLRLRTLFVATFLSTGAAACGGNDPGVPDPVDPGTDEPSPSPEPELAAAWRARYRFPLPDPGGPRVEVPSLLRAWVGEAGPPGLAEALDFWLRSAAPPALARFIAAWNALDEAGLEIEVEGPTALEPRTLWALDAWQHARVRATCPGGDVSLELPPDALAELGFGTDGWGPYPLKVWTASAAVRLSAARSGTIRGRPLRRLRGQAAIACAQRSGELAEDLGAFLREAVPCEDVVRPLGRLAAVARGACAEGLRRVVDWLEGDVAEPQPVSFEMAGVGFGHPPLQFLGADGGGLSVRHADGLVVGTWSWTREP